MNLLQSDARRHHNILHSGSVLNGSLGIGVKRLDKDAATPVCQSRTHKCARIFNRQQASLETDASG
jgi:hypothetical protein